MLTCFVNIYLQIILIKSVSLFFDSMFCRSILMSYDWYVSVAFFPFFKGCCSLQCCFDFWGLLDCDPFDHYMSHGPISLSCPVSFDVSNRRLFVMWYDWLRRCMNERYHEFSLKLYRAFRKIARPSLAP